MHLCTPLWRPLASALLLALPLAVVAQQQPSEPAAPTPPAAAVAAPSAQHTPAQAAPVGYVKTVTGEAWVTTAGQRTPAALGSPVHQGSVLQTSANATLGVTFKDNTVMSFGPDTELTVEDYLFEPAQGDLRLGARLSKGTLNYVSGVIAKLKPAAVTVKTPAGIIGVRGTQFVARVDDLPWTY